jgi:uncharacterized glyoxalase superfamily protein PhnB
MTELLEKDLVYRIIGCAMTVHNTIEPESKEEANRLFNALSTGGQVEMPMQSRLVGMGRLFWGAS